MSDALIYRIQQPFHAFNDLLPVPSTRPDDAETMICVQFSINWLPLVLGAIMPLRFDDAYMEPSEQIKNDGQTLLNLFLHPIQCGGGGEVGSIDIRLLDLGGGCQQVQKKVDGGAWVSIGNPICSGQNGVGVEIGSYDIGNCHVIQHRNVGETTWTDLFTICDGLDGQNGEDGQNGLDGQNGEDGQNGIDGQNGVCEDCGGTVPPNPTEPENEDGLLCSIALNMARALHVVYDQSYSNSDDWFSGITGGTSVATGIAAILFPAIAVEAAVVAGIVGLVSLINTLISGGEQNAFDSTAEDRFRCDLYCILLESGSSAITTDIISQWANKIDEYTIMGEQRFIVSKLLREASPLAFWQWVAYASPEINPAACDCGCGLCSPEMDNPFTYDPETEIENNYGWELISVNASQWECGAVDFPDALTTGTRVPRGFRVTEPSGGVVEAAVAINKTFDEPYDLCTAHIYIENSSQFSNTRLTALWLRLEGANEWTSVVCLKRPIGDHGSPSLVWEGSHRITGIRAFAAVGGGSITIYSVLLNEGQL